MTLPPSANPQFQATSSNQPSANPIADCIDRVVRSCLVEGRTTLGSAVTASRIVQVDNGFEIHIPISVDQLASDHDWLMSCFKRFSKDVTRLRAAGEEADERNQRRKAYQEAEAHPLVKQLKKIFQAETISRERINRDDWIDGLG